MKKSIIILLIIIISIYLTAGCSQTLAPVPVAEIPQNQPEEVPVQEPEPEPEPEDVEPVGIPSPLSGIYAAEDQVNRRIMAIVFDNHPAARWQAGLKDAEIIYEYPVEGSFTRYMGLFLINHPEYQIGPIRSARPYLVTKAYEFDAIFVHVGGSEAAKADSRNLKMAEIDGLTSSPKVFWRNKSKKAPSDLYSNMDVLREVQSVKGFRELSEFEGFVFSDDARDRTGTQAAKVQIIYNKSNSSMFEFDPVSENYLRYKDGKAHNDESDGVQLRADNIIIQKTGIKVLDDEGRLGITVEGKGEGLYISEGLAEEITWSKSNRASKTYYYNKAGNEVVLKSGVTWVQIVGSSTSITME